MAYLVFAFTVSTLLAIMYIPKLVCAEYETQLIVR